MSPWPTTPDAQRRTHAMEKLSSLVRSLANVINDRQPDSQKQTPETEWRRQRDLVVSINTVRDVLSEFLRLVQEGGLAQLTVKGQILVSNGAAEVPLDPPMNATRPNVGILTVQNQILKWDPDLYAQIQDLLFDGGEGSNSIDYGLITEPMAESDDYGGVNNPPTSSYDWGGLD